MKGPFPDVKLLCLAGGARTAFPVATHSSLAHTWGELHQHIFSVPGQLSGSTVSASPRHNQWQISRVGSSSRLVVASRAGMLIGYSIARDGVTAWEKNAVGSKGDTCVRGRTSQQADYREQHLGGGRTQSAAACSFLRRNTVLNRAAPGQLCMGTDFCDTSPCGHKSHLCCMLVVCIAWRIEPSQACICSHLQRGQHVCNKDVPC